MNLQRKILVAGFGEIKNMELIVMPDLHSLQVAIEIHLEKIEKILGPHYKLTLIANHDGHGGLRDADIVFSRCRTGRELLRLSTSFCP